MTDLKTVTAAERNRQSSALRRPAAPGARMVMTSHREPAAELVPPRGVDVAWPAVSRLAALLH